MSGVNNLPFLAFYAFGAILSGFLIGKTHLLQPYELVSGLLATAGAALLYTMDVDTSKARYLGPQVLFGIGIGLGNQVPMTTLQSFSKPENVASTTGIMLSESWKTSPSLMRPMSDSRLTLASVQCHQRCIFCHSSTISLREPATQDTFGDGSSHQRNDSPSYRSIRNSSGIRRPGP